MHIEHGIPLENDYNEAFTVKYSDKLLDRGILYRLKEALIQIKEWRQHCKTFQLHSSLQYQPPAPEAVQNLIQKL